MRDRRRRLALVLLLVLAVVVAAVPPMHRAVTDASARAVGVVAGALHPGDADIERLTKARLDADERARLATQAGDVVSQARALGAAFDTRTHHVLLARVVAVTPLDSASATRSVELDVGSHAGIRPSQAVVASAGLVGRVSSVPPHAATVTLIDDPSSVVGARVVRSSSLARVTGAAPAGLARRVGRNVSLVVPQGGSVRAGDAIVTAGSPGDRPYPPGVRLGTVSSVDADHGQLERSASVVPAVDLASLDLVGVLGAGS